MAESARDQKLGSFGSLPKHRQAHRIVAMKNLFLYQPYTSNKTLRKWLLAFPSQDCVHTSARYPATSHSPVQIEGVADKISHIPSLINIIDHINKVQTQNQISKALQIVSFAWSRACSSLQSRERLSPIQARGEKACHVSGIGTPPT